MNPFKRGIIKWLLRGELMNHETVMPNIQDAYKLIREVWDDEFYLDAKQKTDIVLKNAFELSQFNKDPR